MHIDLAHLRLRSRSFAQRLSEDQAENERLASEIMTLKSTPNLDTYDPGTLADQVAAMERRSTALKQRVENHKREAQDLENEVRRAEAFYRYGVIGRTYLTLHWLMLEPQRAPTPTAALGTALKIIDFASLLLPKRVADEEFGDALEDIGNRAARGEPTWKLHLRAYSAIAWATWNAIKGWRPTREKKGA